MRLEIKFYQHVIRLDCTFFSDQTPTPTKFLKYGEEVGLFTDIKNPFDDAFKTASEYNMKSGKVGTPLLEVRSVLIVGQGR